MDLNNDGFEEISKKLPQNDLFQKSTISTRLIEVKLNKNFSLKILNV